jgi:hypothetical protein
MPKKKESAWKPRYIPSVVWKNEAEKKAFREAKRGRLEF